MLDQPGNSNDMVFESRNTGGDNLSFLRQTDFALDELRRGPERVIAGGNDNTPTAYESSVDNVTTGVNDSGNPEVDFHGNKDFYRRLMSNPEATLGLYSLTSGRGDGRAGSGNGDAIQEQAKGASMDAMAMVMNGQAENLSDALNKKAAMG